MCAEILGLPRALRGVPQSNALWTDWRDKTMIWRFLAREKAEVDLAYREQLVALCAADPILDMIVFGAIFEPRDRPGRPKGWWPAIPFGFQVDLMRWIEEVMAIEPGSPRALLGRGDGVMEKARGMTGTWSFCIYAAHGWRYQDGFLAGFMSYRQDEVDKANRPDSMFNKIRAYLGIDEKVPATRLMRIGDADRAMAVRAPEWLIPEGFDLRKHSSELIIAHPTRTNVITGYSTTGRAAVGGRQTLTVLDEGAKHEKFEAAWQGMSAVTDHRFCLSSADMRFGAGFRNLARVAERAQRTGEAGPSFLRLKPDLHPERDELWREEIEARHAGGAAADEALAREYDLDYEAGSGVHIYADAQAIEPTPLTFSPNLEDLDWCIDPGVAAMTAIHLVKHNPETGDYGLMASYVNNGKPAEFYATLLLGMPLYNLYQYGEEEDRMMSEWFVPYGRKIRYFVGDSAGNQRGGGNLSTFYGDFHDAVRRLSDMRRSVAIWSSDEAQFRRNKPRHDALRWLLQRMDFNDTPDVRRTLEAIRDHRWKAPRDDRETTTVNADPVRTTGHDRVTALEFYAAHRKNMGRMQENAESIGAPRRYTMGGKLIKSKPKPQRYSSWG